MKNKITIRISDDLRDQLGELAQSEGVSTSEFTRSILENYCNSEINYDNENFVENEQQIEEAPELEIDYEEEYNAVKQELEQLNKENKELENTDIVYSAEFLKLVCWIYHQRSTTIISLPDVQYKEFQNTIVKIHSSKIISQELINEFNKVFADLVKVEGNMFLNHGQLGFSKGLFPKFNYSLLNDFIFKKNCGVNTVNL